MPRKANGGLVGLLVMVVAPGVWAGQPDEAQLHELQQRMDALSRASEASSQRSHVAAGILLTGLIVEIVGALFLAGPALVAKQEDVMSLQPQEGWHDLAERDVDAEKRVNFLGALGAVVLALGFVIQFGGTLLTLGIGVAWCACAIAVAMIIPGYVLMFLLGQSPEQKPGEKLAVLWRNFRRLFPARGCRCDHCNRPVTAQTGEVRWREEVPAPGHPFLHSPYGWHVGHPACLDASGWFKPIQTLPGIDPPTVKRATFAEFAAQHPERETFWRGWSNNAATLPSAHGRPADQLISPAEYEYRAVRKKVQRVRA